jgi:hypothetical protein
MPLDLDSRTNRDFEGGSDVTIRVSLVVLTYLVTTRAVSWSDIPVAVRVSFHIGSQWERKSEIERELSQ